MPYCGASQYTGRLPENGDAHTVVTRATPSSPSQVDRGGLLAALSGAAGAGATT